MKQCQEAIVIPVLLRPAIWQILPIARLQFVPRNGKFVTTRKNKDKALSNVAKEIHEIIKEERNLFESSRPEIIGGRPY